MLGFGNSYKAHKDNVIDLFEAYKETRGSINDGVDINFLESRIDSLKNGKYILAVAGEVKAGKSTFINALLGSEILPSDVLQATNAIIEIFKNEKSFLKVEYASGRTEEVYDDIKTPEIEEAKEKLKVLCSIQDEYRDISHVTGLLNKYILSSSEKLTVNENLISQLEKECSDNTVYSKSLSECNELITKYINEHNPDNIPAKIQFGYPLKWNFDELRIVDTPGVHALGGVQDISFNFFESANALIFIKQINPVEALPFRTFVDSIISNRSRETLFLVLTNTGTSKNLSNVGILLKETKRTYEKIIPPERIIEVDSVSKLIHDDLENGKDIAQIKKESDSKKQVINLFKSEAEDREITFSNDMFLKWSGFEKMFEAIEHFSMKAPNLQLEEVLDKIRKGFLKQDVQYEEKCTRLEAKKKDPQEYEHNINTIIKGLDEHTLRTNETIEELKKQFSGRNSDWNSKIGKLKEKYPELITKSQTDESLRKNFWDSNAEIDSLKSEYLKAITDTLNKKIKGKEKAFKKKYNITLPKVDLESIEKQAKDTSYKITPKYHTYTESIWENWNIILLNWTKKSRTKETKVGEEKVFDENKYLGELKTLLNKEFYDIMENLSNNLKEVLDKYLEYYETEMLRQTKERQKDLEEEKNKKQNNQEIISEILEINKKKVLIKPQLDRVEEILEDLR